MRRQLIESCVVFFCFCDINYRLQCHRDLRWYVYLQESSHTVMKRGDHIYNFSLHKSKKNCWKSDSESYLIIHVEALQQEKKLLIAYFLRFIKKTEICVCKEGAKTHSLREALRELAWMTAVLVLFQQREWFMECENPKAAELSKNVEKSTEHCVWAQKRRRREHKSSLKVKFENWNMLWFISSNK